MKHSVIQPMLVTGAHGERRIVCCGPKALQLLLCGARGYQPYGSARKGRCCHTA